MRVLLIEPGYKNKYPPMSLMKISTYHKRKNDDVLFIKGNKVLSKKWDRIYITTLFTFYYNDVLKTINHYKQYVNNLDDIFVGGIMATLLTDDLKKDTGLNNIIKGRLFSSNLLGFHDNENIDIMPLDYDILNDIEYIYPSGDNFFAYITRGCVNKCPFCAVPILEGNLSITNNIKEQIQLSREHFGDKRNLLLMDNNILGIPNFHLQKIVEDLNVLGFKTSKTYTYPSKFLLLYDTYNRYKNQKKNTTLIEKKLLSLYNELLKKKISLKYKEKINILLNNIGSLYQNEQEMILNNIEFFSSLEKKYSYKNKMQRYVDFNQGLDARLLTEEKMKILSNLPIRPFRIAFDKIQYKEIYIQAIKLAIKYNIKEFSNYLLYNFNDHPIDLYKRLKINIELSEKYNVHIYSFPMKYEPIENKKRGYTDSNWNNHFLRSVKAILNVSKGVFSGNKSFFERAFGKNEEEFLEILSMPKTLLIYRLYYEKIGITDNWKKSFRSLSSIEKTELLNLVSNKKYISSSKNINNILRYYNPKILNKEKDINLI